MRSPNLLRLTILILVSAASGSFSEEKPIVERPDLLSPAEFAPYDPKPLSLSTSYGGSASLFGGNFAFQRAIRKEEKKEEKKRERDTPPNPGVAFSLSLSLPGTGEFYAQRGIKGRSLFFWGVEAVGWATFFSYRSSGKAEERRYKSFADENWKFDRYRLAPHDPDAEVFLGELWENDRDEFYEEIGKDDRFRGGWTDIDSVGYSQNRMDYLSKRDKSNSLLRTARYATMGLVVSRVASSLDAMVLARKGISLDVGFDASRGETTVALKKSF